MSKRKVNYQLYKLQLHFFILELNFLHSLKGLTDDIDNIELIINKSDNKNELYIKEENKINNSNSNLMKLTIPNLNFHKKSNSTIGMNENIFITKTDKFSPSPSPNKSSSIANKTSHSVTHFYSKSKSKIQIRSPFRSINQFLEYQDSLSTPITPINLKFPKVKKTLPIKVNNLTKSLNEELGRISKSYGKLDAFKRFKENPLTQFYFDTNNYLAYRTAKMTENKELFRPKLKPLMVEKDPGIERMTNSIFHMRTNLVKTIREFGKGTEGK